MINNQTWDSEGNLVFEEWVETIQLSLDSVGALATLLAVTEILTVTDAANAVGRTAQELTDEALAWAIVSGTEAPIIDE